MKTISCLLLSLIPMLAIGQCHPEMDGNLRVEVNGNSVILYNDTVWRPCDSQYDMEVRLVNGDTLKWVQIDQRGYVNCLCHFNLSVTIDSLPPRLFFAKVYYSRQFQYDTCYIGTVRFRITEPEPFMAPIVADTYQSTCFPVWVNVGQVLPEISLKLFPNPSTGLLYIVTNLHGSKLITISDLGNRSIVEIETDKEEYVVDLSNLPNNMYFVTVRNDDKSQHAKFLKN